MNTVALDRSLFTVSVPSVDVKKFKQFIKLMGWTATVAPTPARARLYDPETGEYVNDETMQAIEDMRSGKDKGYRFDSVEDFKSWCESL